MKGICVLILQAFCKSEIIFSEKFKKVKECKTMDSYEERLHEYRVLGGPRQCIGSWPLGGPAAAGPGAPSAEG